MVYSVFKQHIYTYRAIADSFEFYRTAGLNSGVYAVSGADGRSAVFRVSGVDTLQAGMRLCVSEQTVRHIICPKQTDETKVYWFMVQFIYIVYLQRVRKAECDLRVFEQLLWNASVGLILCRGTADAAVIRCSWRARGDVTSVTASVGWPEARGGLCEARGLVCAINRVRVEMRSFQSERISFVANCGGRTENTRAL